MPSSERTEALDLGDPCLSELGCAQASRLAARLGTELSTGRSFLISSPMRRAIQTALPTAEALGVPLLVHGGAYEFRCAGLNFPGTSIEEITADWPHLDFTEFRSNGRWNYKGSSPMETESEARQRGLQFADWIRKFLSLRQSLGTEDSVVVFAHQTFLDLIIQILLGEGCSKWRYGMVKYKFAHTAVTELSCSEGVSTTWSLVRANDKSHTSTSST